MARVNAPLLAFNRGEVSKTALARVDLQKLQLAAECQLNWLPYVIGPMQLRPGLNYVGEVWADAPAKTLRFVYSKLDTALIELTANLMRVWINNTLLTRAAVGTAIGDSFFAGLGVWSTTNTTSGATATIAGGVCTLACPPVGGLAQIQQSATVAAADIGKEHGIRVVVTQGPVIFRAGSSAGASDVIAQTTLDTGTHSLSCYPGTTTLAVQIESTDTFAKTLTMVAVEPPGTVTIPTPWGVNDLANIRYDQSGDILFVACYGQAQWKIERRGTHPGGRGWSIASYHADDGPFNAAPGIVANFTPGAYYGNTTLTSDRPWFRSGHVGCLFRLFSNGQSNQTVLGNQNAFTPAVRVSGVGTTARDYTWTTSGTWSGTLTLQRSFDGADSGFVDVSTATSNGSPTFTSNTGTGQTPDLDNIIAWERVGFKAGNYTSGNVTATASYSGDGGYGICRVTGYNSPTSVNIEVLVPFSTLQATTDWVEGQWSGVSGYPTSVAFHEGRLGWFGADNVWLSASNDYFSFADINLDGTPTGDGGSINVQLGSGPVDTISWGLSLTRLLIGREQSIGSARSSNFDQPLTPTAIVIRDCSDQGAQRLPAIKAGKRGIFVQQSGLRVYELAFESQEMDYGERDLTRLNTDIGVPGFTDIDKATQPDKMIFLPRGDGQCAALLYDVDDQVEAWWRIQTLGVIENVAVLPQAGNEDAVYFVVRRVINGVTRRFIEQLAPRSNCVGGLVNQQLDCAYTYQGTAVSTVAVPWLPNTLVAVWADGAAIGTATTDSAGNCAMPDGAMHTNIVVGLGGAIIANTALQIGNVLTSSGQTLVID